MRLFKKITFLLFLIFPCWSVSFSQMDSDTKTYSLESAIQTAKAQNPMGKATEFEIQKAFFTLKKTLALKNTPQMRFNLYSGLVPEARGDIFYSPDKSDDLDNFGPFYRLSFDLVKSIYTFGRTSSAIEAARQGLYMEEARKDIVLETLAFETVKAYWGLSAALKAESLGEDMKKNYKKFLTEVEKRVQDEESEVDDLDLFEVRIFNYSVEEMVQESHKLKTLSTKVFNSLLSLELNQAVSISNEPTPHFMFSKNNLSDVIGLAEKLRPEVRAMNSALFALQARVDLAKSQRLPVIFLAAGLGYAYSPNRADQTNPFALDSFNYKRVGAAFGLKWDVNISLYNIEIQRTKSEYKAILEKYNALKSRIGVEVNQAFAEAEKNAALLSEVRKALKSARSWIRLSMENWELGIGDVFRMIRAYEAYYRFLRLEIEREYQNHVSLARLAFVIGDINIYQKWVKNGKVFF